jgi:DNA-binding transcriptional LysR family regulator
MAALEVRPLPIEITASVQMIWHRRDAHDPAHAWFRSLLTRAATLR